MARELRVLAADANLGFIVYLLSMVEQEATALSPEDPSGSGAYKRAGGGR